MREELVIYYEMECNYCGHVWETDDDTYDSCPECGELCNIISERTEEE